MSLADISEGRGIERGDEVYADRPFEGVTVGEVVDLGPRVTIREVDTHRQIEVDESNVWLAGKGYHVRATPQEETLSRGGIL